MLGHAKATMPSRQADLDQKSACRKNQSKRSFPDHSADRAIWATNNWNNLNGAAAPRQLRPTSTWGWRFGNHGDLRGCPGAAAAHGIGAQAMVAALKRLPG